MSILELEGELLYQMTNFLLLRNDVGEQNKNCRLKELLSVELLLSNIAFWMMACVGDENGICPVFTSFFPVYFNL